MKKLLSLLGSVVLAGSTVTAVVSCSYAPSTKKIVKRETKFYSEVSAEALKEGVLADQKLNIPGTADTDGAGIGIDYSDQFFSGQNAIKRFGDLYNPKQGALPKGDTSVSQLFQTVFGRGFKYTIADSFGSLVNENHVGVNKSSNLYKLIKNGYNGTRKSNDVKKTGVALSSPDGSIAKTLNLVSGAANIIFKNDFNPSMGATLISLLTSGTVKDALSSSSDIKDIFNTLDDDLSTYSDQITDIAKSVTQSDIADKLKDGATYKDQLATATNDLFAGLIYFVSGKTFTYDKTAAKVSASKAFWDLIFKIDGSATADGLTPVDNSGKHSNTKYILESVADFASFGITLLHYFRAFDEKYKIQAPSKGTHIFSVDKTNSEVISDILNEPYVNKAAIDNLKTADGSTPDAVNIVSDDFWYYDGSTYSTKLDMQNLIRDLDYYLRPVDTNGYQTLRALAILFGGPQAIGVDAVPQLNPILSTALTPMYSILDSNSGPLYGIIKKYLGVLGDSTVDSIVQDIMSFGKMGVRKIIDWLITDGADGYGKEIQGIVSPLAKIISKIDLSQFAKDDPKLKQILAIVSAVAQYFANDYTGSKFMANPWKQLYSGGLLKDIGNKINEISSDDSVRQVAACLIGLKDLRTAFSMHFKNLIKNIGYALGNEDLALPPFLYKLNDWTVGQLTSYLADTWLPKTNNSNNTNPTDNLSINSQYSFNTAALSNIVDKLLPNQKGVSAMTSGKTNAYSFDDASDDGAGHKVLDPYSKLDNSGIKPLSAIRDGSTVSITLNYTLIDKLKTTDITVDGKQISADNVRGQAIGSSNITVYNVDPSAKKVTIAFMDDGTHNQDINITNLKDATNFAKDTIVYTVNNGQAEATTPVQAIYDLIMNFGASTTSPNKLGTNSSYYVKLKGESYSDPVHLIYNDKPFTTDIDTDGNKTTGNVAKDGFENLLGANDQSFKDGSLLMGISNLYGHWDPNGGGTSNTENAAAAESLMTILSSFAVMSSGSMDQLQSEVYGRYYDPKNWKITDVLQKNLDNSNIDDDTVSELQYNLKFHNPDNGIWYTYQVHMTRNATDGSGWVVDTLYLMN